MALQAVVRRANLDAAGSSTGAIWSRPGRWLPDPRAAI